MIPRRGAGKKRVASTSASAIAERERKVAANELRAFLDSRGYDAAWLAVRIGVGFSRAQEIAFGALPSMPEKERIVAMLREVI